MSMRHTHIDMINYAISAVLVASRSNAQILQHRGVEGLQLLIKFIHTNESEEYQCVLGL